MIQDWKVTILQRLPHRSVSSEPHIMFPSLGSLALGGGAPIESGAYAQELHRMRGRGRGTEIPLLGGCMLGLMCTRSQGKAGTPSESESDLPLVLGRSPGKTRVCCVSLWGQNIGGIE